VLSQYCAAEYVTRYILVRPVVLPTLFVQGPINQFPSLATTTNPTTILTPPSSSPHLRTTYPPKFAMSSASPLQRASRAIPSRLKPPLAVFLNLGISTLLGYLASPWISSDLAAIDRPMKNLSDYSALVAWRAVEILGYWIGGWDGELPRSPPQTRDDNPEQLRKPRL
jgi:hypothetical protein